MLIRNIMTKTPFIKLYELKNPLTLKGVSKPIKIQPLNDIVVIEDSTGERISLNLPKIDDISFLELTTPEAPGSFKPLKLPIPKPPKLLALRPSKPLEPENKPSEPMFKPPKELIKPVDSLNPDEMQLNLVTSLYYRVRTKIFKKKLDKNSSTPNTYKQTLKSPNVKE